MCTFSSKAISPLTGVQISVEERERNSVISNESISLPEKTELSIRKEELEPDNLPKPLQMPSSDDPMVVNKLEVSVLGAIHKDPDVYSISEVREDHDESMDDDGIDEKSCKKAEIHLAGFQILSDSSETNVNTVKTEQMSSRSSLKACNNERTKTLRMNTDKCQEPNGINKTTKVKKEETMETVSSATKQSMIEKNILQEELAKIKALTEAKKREIQREEQELIKIQEIKEARKRLIEEQARESIRRREKEELATAAGLAKIQEMQKAAKEAMLEKKLVEEELAKIKAIAKARKREMEKEEQKLNMIRARNNERKSSIEVEPIGEERVKGMRKKEADEFVTKVMIEATKKAIEAEKRGEEQVGRIRTMSEARKREMKKQMKVHSRTSAATNQRVVENTNVAKVGKTNCTTRLKSAQKDTLEEDRPGASGKDCTVSVAEVTPLSTKMYNMTDERKQQKSRYRFKKEENQIQNITLEEDELQEQLAEIKAMAKMRKEKMRQKSSELARIQGLSRSVTRKNIIQMTNRDEKDGGQEGTIVTIDCNRKEEKDEFVKTDGGKRTEAASITKKKQAYQKELMGCQVEVESVRDARLSKIRTLVQSRYRESRQRNVVNSDATSYDNTKDMEPKNKIDSSFSSNSTTSLSPFKGKDPCSMSRMQLDTRTSEALHVLQTTRQLTEVTNAVMTLENSTRISYECCEAFISNGAPVIMYKFIRLCNRSLPHVELLQYILMTLCNVSKISALILGIITANCVDILLDILQMFRDKEMIFSLAATLLRRIIFSDEKMVVSLSRGISDFRFHSKLTGRCISFHNIPTDTM